VRRLPRRPRPLLPLLRHRPRRTQEGRQRVTFTEA
jgi:hypothetical protein